MNRQKCKKAILAVLAASCITGTSLAEDQASDWQQIYPGVWRIQAGEAQALTLLNAAEARPRATRLERMASPEFPLNSDHIDTAQRHGQTHLRFPLERGEQLYGLGLNFKSVNQRGKVLHLKPSYYMDRDDGRTHAPIPFYVSSLGYGVFINSAEYLWVYAGSNVRQDARDKPVYRDRTTDPEWTHQPYSDSVEVMVPANGAEIYVIAGPTPMEVVRRFNLLTGGGVLPPKWGLGFQHRVPTKYSDEQVLAEVDEFRKRDFPLDMIGLEPGWHSSAYPTTFDWSPERFPDPARFLKAMGARGIHTNFWFNPYLSPKSSLFEALLPLSGSHTVYNGIAPDYSLTEARNVFQQHLQETLIDIGAAGFKIDEVDGGDDTLWPETAEFPSGIKPAWQRQTYFLRIQKLIDQAYRDTGRRSWGLARANQAGSVGYPFVQYSDHYDHKDYVTAMVNSSFIGVLWTPEIRRAADGEEWLRRMQSVIASPLAMLNAWYDGTKPWSFPEVEDAVRDVAYLRMQLLPYLYTAFAQYHFDGTPPVRSMNLVWSIEPGADEAWKQALLAAPDDQFMLGDDLLVAPVFSGENSREVIFPEGKWYDFYTGKLAGEAEVRRVETPLARLPLYVRDGAIIPLLERTRQLPAPGEKQNLILRHYGTADGQGQLYDDDGVSFDYEDGHYQWRHFSATQKAGEWQTRISDSTAGKPDSYDLIRWEHRH